MPQIDKSSTLGLMDPNDDFIRETPSALAMIVCDQVITDRRTNNKTIVNTFNAVICGRFPIVHHRITVFVSLHGGRGEYDASLTLTKEGATAPIFSTAGPIQFKDPLTVVEMAFEIRSIRFEEPGVYCFDFNCNGEHIFSRRLQVSPRQ